jgi:hypothetical protein
MSTLSFAQALKRAEILASQSLPEALQERLRCAVELVRQGHCLQRDDGTWQVQSTSTPDKSYAVNGQCSCEDACYRAPDGRCKHKLAQYLARKTLALMSAAPTGAEPTPDQSYSGNLETTDSGVFGSGTKKFPLPEARASVNVRVQISGYDVQWTLRDHDEAQLAIRLEALLNRYQVPQASQAPAPSPGQAGWCAVHQVQMKQTTKEGQSWWSHKTPDGWCKGK